MLPGASAQASGGSGSGQQRLRHQGRCYSGER